MKISGTFEVDDYEVNAVLLEVGETCWFEGQLCVVTTAFSENGRMRIMRMSDRSRKTIFNDDRVYRAKFLGSTRE